MMTSPALGTPENPVRIGTRASALATTQTGMVARALKAAGLAIEIVHITTEGDTARASLSALGGTGVFAARLRSALLDGECDVAVHSAKDLPAADAHRLTIGAYPERERVSDVLVATSGMKLADLPAASRIGTGSPRRAAQLRAARPDLEMVDIRGNVPTRLGRVRGSDLEGAGDLDGVVLARAGLVRLGLDSYVTDDLSGVLLPAGAQGALAVEIRSSDYERAEASGLTEAVASLDHYPTRLAVEAERAFLRALGAGCSAPIGVLGTLDGNTMRLHGRIVSLDGHDMVDETRSVGVNGDTGVSIDAGEREDAIARARRLGKDLAQAFIDAGAQNFTDIHPAPRDTDEKTLWG